MRPGTLCASYGKIVSSSDPPRDDHEITGMRHMESSEHPKLTRSKSAWNIFIIRPCGGGCLGVRDNKLLFRSHGL